MHFNILNGAGVRNFTPTQLIYVSSGSFYTVVCLGRQVHSFEYKATESMSALNGFTQKGEEFAQRYILLVTGVCCVSYGFKIRLNQ